MRDKKVVMLKGEYSGWKGIVLKETGYCDIGGVVCKIKLRKTKTKTGEWSHDFFNEVRK